MTVEHAVVYALEQAPEPMMVTTKPPAPGERAPHPPAALPAGLTEREADILRLLAQGLTYAQIAQQLIISPHTVNAHLRTIYGKLGVTSRAAATRFAVAHHLA